MQESHSLPQAARHTDGHTLVSKDCSLSDKYTEFIATHLNSLKKKCQHFTACIDKLLQDVNLVQLLRGEDLNLKKICGLVYQNGNGNNNTLEGKCTATERENIRSGFEKNLEDKFLDSWNNVEKCLSNNYGDAERTTRVDEICGLAKKQPVICKKYKIHKTVQTFFNEQIHHLKCTCQNLNASPDDHHSNLPMYAAIGGSIGLLILLIIIGICFLCYRRRRKSKDRKRSPTVIYLPAPNSDNHPVYQELYDDRGQTSPSNNPPMLPMRYTTHPSAFSNQNRRNDEEPAYLEPVEVGYRPKLPPMRGHTVNNPSYGAPPEYSEKAEDKSKPPNDDTENEYFEPIPSPAKQDEDRSYDPLGRNETDTANSPASYEAIVPAPSDKPLGPVPAKRPKKEDREAESHYFELEDVKDIGKS